MKTGLIEGESITAYHAANAFSASKLAVFRRLPALYHAYYIAKTLPPKAPTAAIDVGNAVDCLLLEGVDEYAKRVVIHPEAYGPEGKDWNWNAKECKAWAKQHEGKTILSPSEAELVDQMCQTVYRHPDAAALLERGHPARTFRFDYGFAMAQCRPDWLNLQGTTIPSTGEKTGPYWIELKTAASLNKADYYGFKDAYLDREYWLQLPLYREVMVDVLRKMDTALEPRPFYIVVDKGEIPFCQVFDPLATERGRYHFDMARKKVLRDVERLAECYRENHWPGLPQSIQPLELPAWREKQLEGELA